MRFNLAVPGGLSFLLHESFSAPVVGLDRFRPEDRPPLFLSFASYHVMITLGMLFIGITLLASFLRWRGRLYETRWLLWVFVFAVLGAVAANQFGWIAAEVGRQPWIVYGEMLTRDAISVNVPAGHILTSMILFGLVYTLLLVVWIYLTRRKLLGGPATVAGDREQTS